MIDYKNSKVKEEEINIFGAICFLACIALSVIIYIIY